MNARLWAHGEPVTVTCDEHGRPLAFHWGGRRYAVERVCNRWRVKGAWWKGETGEREYIKLATTGGLLCLLARAWEEEAWVLVRVYD